MNDCRFAKDERVKKNAEFKMLFKTGKKASVQGAKLFYKPNGLCKNRIGFSLPRGYGNAVQRNQSKRYSREVYRLLKAHLKVGYDIIFLVYPGENSFATRACLLKTLCEKSGLLK